LRSTEIIDGIKGGALIVVSSAPFGVLFGALAVDNGLSLTEVALMSATIYAGASQLVGIELFGQHVAPWLVILSVFAVNFRHVLYSASVARPFSRFSFFQKLIAFFVLIDPQYAETARRADSGKEITFAWYMSFAAIIYVAWVTFSVLGGAFGALLGDPREWAIDVLLPIYFLGLVLGFRRKPGFYPVAAASFIGSVAGYALVGSPWHVSIGAIAGIIVATLLPLPAQPEAEPVEAAE
jgi:predicted branched-subunit amino acid permease